MNDKRAKDIMTTDVIVANKNDIIANVANLLTRDNIFRWYEEVWRWDESNSSI